MTKNPNQPVVLIKIEQESEVDHPLALLFLSRSLRGAGFESEIRMRRSQKFDAKEFAKEILALNPLFVGVSSITGRQCYDARNISVAIKELNPQMPIVWGGIHTSLVPMQTLKEPYIDFIIFQEGEETIVELSERILENKTDYENILGLGYKKDGECFQNQDRPFIHLPDYELEEQDFEKVDFNRAIYVDPTTKERMTQIQTSRGCPFNCGFCYSVRFTKRRMRYFEPEAIERMGRILNQKYGVSGVLFTDDNIYFNYERMYDIVERLKNVGIYSRYLQTRVEDVNEDSLKKLTELGVTRLFFGIETGSWSTKVLIAKKIPNELILEKMRLLSKFPKMGVTTAMIVGFPTETERSIQETVKLGVQMTDIHPNTVVTLQTYVPFPGTDLYQLAVGCGYEIPKTPEEYKDLDSFDGDIDIKWATYNGMQGVELSRHLNLMNKYAAMLTHSPSTSLIRTLGKKVLRQFARYRLLHNYFDYPFEIGILARFNRYIRHYYKEKGGTSYLKDRYQVKKKPKLGEKAPVVRDAYTGIATTN